MNECKETKMKEIVDRILQDEVVDIVGEDKRYHVSVQKKGNNFLFAFSRKANFDRGYSRQSLYLEEIKELGEKLIALYAELENRKKFKDGDCIYYVDDEGDLCHFIFNTGNVYHKTMIVTGNAFKDPEKAGEHKDEIRDMYQRLEDQGII